MCTLPLCSTRLGVPQREDHVCFIQQDVSALAECLCWVDTQACGERYELFNEGAREEEERTLWWHWAGDS